MNTYFIPVKRKNRKDYKIEKISGPSKLDIYSKLNRDDSVEAYHEVVKKYKIHYKTLNGISKTIIIYADNKKEAIELAKYEVENIYKISRIK